MKAKELNIISTEKKTGASREMFISPTSASDGMVSATNEALLKIKSAEVDSIRQVYEYKDSCVSEIDAEASDRKNEIRNTPGIIKNENGNIIKFWTGSQEEYDAVGIKESETMYFIKEK